MIIQRAFMFAGITIPSILFYFATEKYHGTPHIILVFINLLQFLWPLAYDGGVGLLADNACLAVLGATLGVGMSFYIRDLRRYSNDSEKIRSLAPFYKVLDRWNENPTRSPSGDRSPGTSPSAGQKPTAIPVIEQDSRWWLLQSILYILLSVPVMSFFDGLLRVCQLPPDTDTTGYWHRLTPAWRTLAYYLMAGFTLHLHVGIVEILYRLVLTLRLTLVQLAHSLFRLPSAAKLLTRYYDETKHFISQPSLFDQPWLAHSVHNLWSCRWHQIFRPGFTKLAYQPVRSLFPPTTTKKSDTAPSTAIYAGRMAATMAVFLASGLLHDYILVAMVGYSKMRSYPGILGQQTLFFLIQGVATIISAPATPLSKYWRGLPLFVCRLFTLMWIVYTAPIFVDPYLRIGLHREAEVPLYPRTFDPYIGDIFCPY